MTQHSYFYYIPQTNTCIHMFITELFTIAKRRKQSKYSSKDEWINKL